MDDVHLQVHEYSINRVLRWSVEMVLHTVELSLANMLVEQRDSGGLHEALLRLLISLLSVE